MACTARQPHSCTASSHTRPTKFEKAASTSPTSSNTKRLNGRSLFHRVMGKLAGTISSGCGVDVFSALHFAFVRFGLRRCRRLSPAAISNVLSVLRRAVRLMESPRTKRDGIAKAVLLEYRSAIQQTKGGLRRPTKKMF
eukprot:12409897-Karenia_brevis.AAC.1